MSQTYPLDLDWVPAWGTILTAWYTFPKCQAKDYNSETSGNTNQRNKELDCHTVTFFCGQDGLYWNQDNQSLFVSVVFKYLLTRAPGLFTNYQISALPPAAHVMEDPAHPPSRANGAQGQRKKTIRATKNKPTTQNKPGPNNMET